MGTDFKTSLKTLSAEFAAPEPGHHIASLAALIDESKAAGAKCVCAVCSPIFAHDDGQVLCEGCKTVLGKFTLDENSGRVALVSLKTAENSLKTGEKADNLRKSDKNEKGQNEKKLNPSNRLIVTQTKAAESSAAAAALYSSVKATFLKENRNLERPLIEKWSRRLYPKIFENWTELAGYY